MNQCQIRGCRKLEWKCADCGQTVSTATLILRGQWISVKDGPPPPMETVLLCVDENVIVDWNESTQANEDPSYCSWESWPEAFISGEGVTHWMALPEPPKDSRD